MDHTDQVSLGQVKLGTVEDVQTQVRQDIRAYLDVHLTHPKSKSYPLAPNGIVSTTGAGKSRAVVEEIAVRCAKEQIPALILCHTQKACEDYVDAIKALGAPVTHYFGRAPWQEGDPPGGTAFTCWKMKSVEKAGERNQAPAHSVCRECPNGKMRAMREGKDGGAALQWLIEKGFDPDNTETTRPCRFLYDALPEQMRGMVIVAPVQAFSKGLGELKTYGEGGEILKEKRIIVVDERVDLGKEVVISGHAINSWFESIAREKIKIEEEFYRKKSLRSMGVPERDDEILMLERNLVGIDKIKDLLETVQAAIAHDTLSAAGEIRPETYYRLHSKINDGPHARLTPEVVDSAYQAARGLMKSGTARWEKVYYSYDFDDHVIPLRALAAIRHSVATGSARWIKNGFQVFQTTPIIDWALEEGSVLFLDATMGMGMRKIIEHMGGKVNESRAEQNMNVTRHVGFGYFRGNLRKNGYKATAETALKDIRLFAETMPPGQAAIMTHLSYITRTHKDFGKNGIKGVDLAEDTCAKFSNENSVHLGWFGRHERGHDDWNGMDLAIFGMPLISNEAASALYSAERAALLAAGIDWPAWTDIKSTENEAVPLPADPTIREWMLDHYAQTMTQAVGRARAVRSERKINVSLFGGIETPEMDSALAKHGVVVSKWTKNVIHNFKLGRIPEEGYVDVGMAIDITTTLGIPVSEREVAETMLWLGSPFEKKDISAELRARRAAGLLPPARAGRPTKEEMSKRRGRGYWKPVSNASRLPASDRPTNEENDQILPVTVLNPQN